jgi:hypothetical protein
MTKTGGRKSLLLKFSNLNKNICFDSKDFADLGILELLLSGEFFIHIPYYYTRPPITGTVANYNKNGINLNMVILLQNDLGLDEEYTGGMVIPPETIS